MIILIHIYIEHIKELMMQGPRPLSKAIHDLTRRRKFEIGLFLELDQNLENLFMILFMFDG